MIKAEAEEKERKQKKTKKKSAPGAIRTRDPLLSGCMASSIMSAARAEAYARIISPPPHS